MSTFTMPTGDNTIDNLIGELSYLVQKFGKNSPEIHEFIQKHKEVTFVDRVTALMHTFEEIASGLIIFIGGISCQNNQRNWKSGSSENLYQKDPSDPADWWK